MIFNALMAIFIPACTAGVVLLLASRLSGASSAVRQSAGAVGLALGFVAGQFLILGKPAFPPIDGTSWLPYLAGMAMCAGMICGTFAQRGWVNWLVAILICASVPYLLLQTQFKYTWSPDQGKLAEGIFHLAGIFVALLLIWKSIDRAVRTIPGIVVPLALIVICAGSAGVIMMGESALVAQLAGCLAAGLGAVAVLAFFIKDFTPGTGTTAVLVTLLAGFWINAYFYANVPAPSALLLVAAPLMLWLGTLPFISRMSELKSGLARLSLVTLPVALALAYSLHTFLAKPAVSDYY